MDNKKLIKERERLLKKQEKLDKRLSKIDEDLNEELEKREYIQSHENEIYAHRIHRARVHAKNSPPIRSILEEIGNSVTHGIGAVLAAVALGFMVKNSSGFPQMFSSIIYGISMIFMMLMSCIYHALPAKSMGKHVLRRFDYTSIYILIGGTFTPLYLQFFIDHLHALSIVLCALQWAIIITGIVNVCVFGPGRHKAINLTLYIVLGWCGVMFIPYLIKYDLQLFWYILAGGVVYTIGIIPFLLKNKAAHFIWHFFVLGGAILQFIGIFLSLYI